MKNLLILIIKFYQMIVSPFFGQRCRFYPSCSNYAINAIQCHGFLKGFRLSLKRICSCHPFNEGGYDPVKKIET